MSSLSSNKAESGNPAPALGSKVNPEDMASHSIAELERRVLLQQERIRELEDQIREKDKFRQSTVRRRDKSPRRNKHFAGGIKDEHKGQFLFKGAIDRVAELKIKLLLIRASLALRDNQPKTVYICANRAHDAAIALEYVPLERKCKFLLALGITLVLQTPDLPFDILDHHHRSENAVDNLLAQCVKCKKYYVEGKWAEIYLQLQQREGRDNSRLALIFSERRGSVSSESPLPSRQLSIIEEMEEVPGSEYGDDMLESVNWGSVDGEEGDADYNHGTRPRPKPASVMGSHTRSSSRAGSRASSRARSRRQSKLSLEEELQAVIRKHKHRHKPSLEEELKGKEDLFSSSPVE
ncbi:MAG: hypothetical protein M1820_009199 [Bogoriella megaspora]|nr:MAG: hypothetical protein M1820_009199 [Bogoriella megaspora]